MPRSQRRNIPLASRLARALPVAAGLFALAGCYSAPSTLHHLTPLAAPDDCPYGNPYLAVMNPTNSSFDLFAYTANGVRRYVGAVNPTTTRIETVGTPLEHGGTPLVVPMGELANNGGALALAQRVQVARKCDGPAK